MRCIKHCFHTCNALPAFNVRSLYRSYFLLLLYIWYILCNTYIIIIYCILFQDCHIMFVRAACCEHKMLMLLNVKWVKCHASWLWQYRALWCCVFFTIETRGVEKGPHFGSTVLKKIYGHISVTSTVWKSSWVQIFCALTGLKSGVGSSYSRGKKCSLGNSKVTMFDSWLPYLSLILDYIPEFYDFVWRCFTAKKKNADFSKSQNVHAFQLVCLSCLFSVF